MKKINFLKKLLPVILTAIIFSIIATIIGYWIFEGGWLFLPIPILAGMAMALIQKENKSYKFIDKLLIGSLIFGFLAMFLVCLRMYLIAHSTNPTIPLIFNKKDYLTLSLVFSFVSFLGGLVGIVIKGICFIKICQQKNVHFAKKK